MALRSDRIKTDKSSLDNNTDIISKIMIRKKEIKDLNYLLCNMTVLNQMVLSQVLNRWMVIPSLDRQRM